MSTIVTRSGKGSPLTHVEVDANFTNLNTDKYQEGSAIGAVTPAAGTFTTLTATGQTSLGGAAGSEGLRVNTTASGTRYVSVSGSTGAGNPNIIASAGNLVVSGGSTSGVIFYSNSYGAQQMAVSHTASAVNYVQVTGAATTGAPTISSQGSDTNINMSFVSKGNSGFRFFSQGGGSRQFQINNTSSAVNYALVTGAVAGAGPVYSVEGSDTNLDLNLTTKGTGAINFYANANDIGFKVSSNGTTGNSWTVYGSSVSPILEASGSSTNVNGIIRTKGSGIMAFRTNLNDEQLRIAHTASAVNYVQVTGAATSSDPTISAQGSDASINFTYLTKGSAGEHRFSTNTGGNIQFKVTHTASAVNYVQTSGSTTGFGAKVFAAGSDSNIPFVVQPKGTGALQAQQTDSTATGGNARGANAVDWQTSRATAAQVANGAYANIAGGASNTSSGSYAVIGGGGGNSNGGFFGTIAGGWNNACNGLVASISGGYGNTANGYYNYIGAGFTNSGTAAAAVTTQSGTMNGTTAVTLSGSNANIKVGQYIAGTSIASDTYVAAISGTSLTLSKVASGSSTSTLSFYTPHGVVVGGGNNQATGSYSFIGGGGDAGTAANRNVASGDWSTVAGGIKNTASGVGSFVGGGGYDASASIVGNTASGLLATITGGISNQATAAGSSISGGAYNTASGAYSTVLGAQVGTTRGIQGQFIFGLATGNYNRGNFQSGLLNLFAITTDATATVLRSNISAAGTTNQVILPNNSAYYFKGEVVAGVTGGGNTKGWTVEGVIKRGANAASTAIVGTATVVSAYADAGAATWALTATADTTNGGLAITFTGQAATTIRCVAKIETTEMTY